MQGINFVDVRIEIISLTGATKGSTFVENFQANAIKN
jgi:hypothetical protein